MNFRKCAICGEELVWVQVMGCVGYAPCELHPRAGIE